MIGTAVHSQPHYMIGRVRRLRGGLSSVNSRFQQRQLSLVAWLRSLFSNTRLALSALLICAFVAGTVLCGPEHERLEGDESAASQTLSVEKAGAAQNTAQVAKAPANQTAPSKGAVPALCTGHCAAHIMSLPIQITQAVVPFELRAAWIVFNDQWMQASSPSRLERPPRV